MRKHFVLAILSAVVLSLAAAAAHAAESKDTSGKKDMSKANAAECAKMGCMGTDKDGNLVCTMDHHLLATKHDCGGGMSLYTDSMGNCVDEKTGAVKKEAMHDKNGRPFYMMADGKTASACPKCAMGECSRECPAPKVAASEVHKCSASCKHPSMTFAQSMDMMMKDMPKDSGTKPANKK